MYLTVYVGAAGRHTAEGRLIETDEDVRRWLLEAAGMAVVPFQAFGAQEDTGWFRMSVGAVSDAALARVVPRLAEALGQLR
jgi:aspartate aminotransferase